MASASLAAPAAVAVTAWTAICAPDVLQCILRLDEPARARHLARDAAWPLGRLDVAATASTSVARSWLGPGHPVWARRDALSDEWPDWSRLADDGDAGLWMNPPHADVSPWLRRAAATAEAGRTVVGLLPVRTSSAEWHDVILPRAEVVVLARRLRYGHPSGTRGSAPFSSAVVVWPGPRPSRAAARHLLAAWAADGWGTLMHAPPTRVGSHGRQR